MQEIKRLFDSVESIAIEISSLIVSSSSDYSTQQNSSGDTQLELDLQCDELIVSRLKELEFIKMIASEEREDQELLHSDGRLYVAYDPLDGSSLIDVNLSVGTIFGIYDAEFSASKMIASIYVVYGPRVEIVRAYGGDIEHLIYRGERFVEQKRPKLLNRGKLNSPGGTQQFWSREHKKMVDALFAQGYRLRYSGGMVPDLHQILLKGGGLFSYPSAADNPDGKLRKLFEVFPFAFIYECAGGEAIDESGRRVLDLECQNPHESTPCFFGSKYEIELVKSSYAK